MGFKLDREHLWSCEVEDRAGGVAAKLSALAQAGANLEFILTRRQPDKPGTGVLYVAPVTGPMQVRAACRDRPWDSYPARAFRYSCSAIMYSPLAASNSARLWASGAIARLSFASTAASDSRYRRSASA